MPRQRGRKGGEGKAATGGGATVAAATPAAGDLPAVDAAALQARIAQLALVEKEAASSEAEAAAERAAAAKALAKAIKRETKALEEQLASLQSGDETESYLKQRLLAEISERKKQESAHQTQTAKLEVLQKEHNASKAELTRWHTEKLMLQNLSRELTNKLKENQDISTRALEAERKLNEQLQAKLTLAAQQAEAQGEKFAQLNADHMSMLTKFQEFITKNDASAQEQKAYHEAAATRIQAFQNRSEGLEKLAELQAQQIEVYKKETEELIATNRALLQKTTVQEEISTKQQQHFAEIKAAIEKVQKERLKTEKANILLQSRLDKQNAAAIKVAQEQAALAQSYLAQSEKVKKLEGLCRALQARNENEAKALQSVLEEPQAAVAEVKEPIVAEPETETATTE